MEPEDELLTPPLEEIPAENDELNDFDPYRLKGDDGYTPSTIDPSLIDDQALISEVQRRHHLYQQPAGQQYVDSYTSSYGADPRLAQIVELSYTNPQMAEALRLQIAEERTANRIDQQLE